ncbi:MAG TPA: MaoC/PaaZ C-terminal domain-containing protein [Acidimicrobiia bacterium]
MPFPISIVGRSTAPVTHDIDAAWLASFSRAVGDATDADLGHPLFPVCIEWPAVTAAARLDDGTLLPDERRRGIHATHDLTIHRLLRAGDAVTTVATVEALAARRRGTFQQLRLDTRDAEGSLVATTVMGSMFIGVAVEGPLPEESAAHDEPALASEPTPEPAPEPAVPIAIPIAVSVDQAREYSEASRIWNPIHTDATAAVAAGLTAPILHGTCTLALATSAALAWAGIDRTTVRRIRVRFAGMVAMPSTIELRVARTSPHELHFDVVDSAGTPVLRDGRVTL